MKPRVRVREKDSRERERRENIPPLSSDCPGLVVDGEAPERRGRRYLSIYFDQGIPVMESDHGSDSSNHPVSPPAVTVSESDPHSSVNEGQPNPSVNKGDPNPSVNEGDPNPSVNEGDPNPSVNEGDPNSGVKSGSSTPSPSSSSSSSGSSFDEALFEDDVNNETKPNAIDASSPNSVDDLDAPLKDEKEIEFYSDSSPSPMSAGAGPSEPAESSQQIELFTQSPQTQVMERPEDTTPYRIPSSVFARSKSDNTNGMEYFGKSGELINSNSSSPQLATPEPERCSDLVESDIVTAAAAETMKEVLRAAAEEHSKEKPAEPVGAHHSPTASRHSDASGASVRSFAFPM
ncbi:hypothetical protein Sjap_009721 [Stephania japonica]|uniref:Uncharacterized protein n=1 Tax=Stephania japonica TaxID=461633 RepID=A0AAP0P3Z1_9MAGN